MLTTNLITVEGRDAKPNDIIGPAMSPPFLAPRRLVLVTGMLDRFEQRGDQRVPRSIEPLNPLFTALEAASLPDTTLLVFTGGRGGRRNPFLDRMKKIKTVLIEEYPELKGDALLRYIRDEAAARGIRFRAGAAHGPGHEGGERPRESDPALMLANLLKSDTLSIANELDKLALYTLGRDATVDDVAVACSGEREVVVFDFVDGVMDGDLGKAFKALVFLRRESGSTQGLLTMLANAYRQAATILEMLDEGLEPEAIGRAISRPWPNLRDRAIRRAKALGPRGVKAAYAAIVEADRTNKLGEVDEDLALEILMTRLAALTAPAPRR
jgi:DNA polymerase III subunit delta